MMPEGDPERENTYVIDNDELCKKSLDKSPLLAMIVRILRF